MADALLMGVYRGLVQTANDPENRFRIRMLVPQVLGDLATDWALPFYPIGLSQLPARGDPVWAMFEGGDPANPVWAGSWQRLGLPAILGSDDVVAYVSQTHVLF
jgi:hypothetical protein